MNRTIRHQLVFVIILRFKLKKFAWNKVCKNISPDTDHLYQRKKAKIELSCTMYHLIADTFEYCIWQFDYVLKSNIFTSCFLEIQKLISGKCRDLFSHNAQLCHSFHSSWSEKNSIWSKTYHSFWNVSKRIETQNRTFLDDRVIDDFEILWHTRIFFVTWQTLWVDGNVSEICTELISKLKFFWIFNPECPESFVSQVFSFRNLFHYLRSVFLRQVKAILFISGNIYQLLPINTSHERCINEYWSLLEKIDITITTIWSIHHDA